MALPTKSEVSTLDYTDWSLPIVHVEGKTFGATPTVNANVYINVSGTWKLADEVHVNVSGTWKRVTDDSLPVNVSGTWKQLTSGGGGGATTSSFGLDFTDWSLPIALIPA